MTEPEVDELHLRVAGGFSKLPLTEMEQLVEHLGLESKEFKGKTEGAFRWENPNPDSCIQKRILRFFI